MKRVFLLLTLLCSMVVNAQGQNWPQVNSYPYSPQYVVPAAVPVYVHSTLHNYVGIGSPEYLYRQAFQYLHANGVNERYYYAGVTNSYMCDPNAVTLALGTSSTSTYYNCGTSASSSKGLWIYINSPEIFLESSTSASYEQNYDSYVATRMLKTICAKGGCTNPGNERIPYILTKQAGLLQYPLVAYPFNGSNLTLPSSNFNGTRILGYGPFKCVDQPGADSYVCIEGLPFYSATVPQHEFRIVKTSYTSPSGGYLGHGASMCATDTQTNCINSFLTPASWTEQFQSWVHFSPLVPPAIAYDTLRGKYWMALGQRLMQNTGKATTATTWTNKSFVVAPLNPDNLSEGNIAYWVYDMTYNASNDLIVMLAVGAFSPNKHITRIITIPAGATPFNNAFCTNEFSCSALGSTLFTSKKIMEYSLSGTDLSSSPVIHPSGMHVKLDCSHYDAGPDNTKLPYCFVTYVDSTISRTMRVMKVYLNSSGSRAVMQSNRVLGFTSWPPVTPTQVPLALDGNYSSACTTCSNHAIVTDPFVYSPQFGVSSLTSGGWTGWTYSGIPGWFSTIRSHASLEKVVRSYNGQPYYIMRTNVDEQTN